MRLVGNRTQHIQLTPKLIEAFDRFIAGSMVGDLLVYKLAEGPQLPKKYHQ